MTDAQGELINYAEKSPFYHAIHADRYQRQDLIRSYEVKQNRCLIVFVGPLDTPVIAPFNDVLADVEDGAPLDLLLHSPGGDGETAVRVAKMCHAKRDDFRVLVPDQAKSAGTILALGAESIVMSDTSDLGPVDPQIFMPRRNEWVPAKGIEEAVRDLDERVKSNPDAYPLYASLLADIDAVVLQRARAANQRVEALVEEALQCRHTPGDKPADELANELVSFDVHSAFVGHEKARELGLPVEYVNKSDEAWGLVWRLYTKYALLIGRELIQFLIEGRRVSLPFHWATP